MCGLKEEDYSIINANKTAMATWHALQVKYTRTDSVTAVEYQAKIQNLEFKLEKGIDFAWSELCEYRRKLISANTAMRPAYPDEVLFTILQTKLLEEGTYMSVLDGFITQPGLPVSNKLKMLYEKEAMMKYTTSTTKEKAHATKQIKWKTHKPAWKSRDTSQDDEMSDADDTRCFICDSTQHWKTDCPYSEEVKCYAIKLRLRERETC
jgi:hypothetical protein